MTEEQIRELIEYVLQVVPWMRATAKYKVFRDLPVPKGWVKIDGFETGWIKVSAIDAIILYEVEDGDDKKRLCGEILIHNRLISIPEPVEQNARRIILAVMMQQLANDDFAVRSERNNPPQEIKVRKGEE